MCLPLAPLAIAATLIGSATSAYGAIQQGNAAASAASYQSKVDVEQAQAAQTAARINEQQTYRQGDQLQGRAIAAAGANGVDVNSGSALQGQRDIATATQRNVSDQTYNAQTVTWGSLNDTGLLAAQGKQAQLAGDIGAGSTLIGSAGQVASKWGAWQTPAPSGGF